MLEVIGDIVLVLAIVGGIILFTKANADYLPNKETAEGNKNKRTAENNSDNPDFIDYDGMGNQGRFPKR